MSRSFLHPGPRGRPEPAERLQLADPAERVTAGRLAGVLYLAGGASGLAWLAVPGAEITHPHWGLVMAVFSVVSGLACLMTPWQHSPLVAFYASSAIALVVIGGVIASTGGVTSPARFYLFMTAAHAAFFLPRRPAVGFLFGVMLVHATPLLYDARATDITFVAEAVVIVPVYLVVGGLIIAAKDKLSRLHDDARAESRRDPLTGLSNRRALLERLDALADRTRDAGASGLLLLDLDDFKRANTLHGHPGGDRALRAAAQALRTAVRAGDLTIRLGGDEFAVLAPGIDAEGMQHLAERVLDAIHTADGSLEMVGFTLAASAGWAIFPHDAATAEELMSIADQSLLHAKALGKQRTVGPPAFDTGVQSMIARHSIPSSEGSARHGTTESRRGRQDSAISG